MNWFKKKAQPEPKPVPVKQYIPHEQTPVYEQIRRQFELNNSDYLLGKIDSDTYLANNREIKDRSEKIATERLDKIEKALHDLE